MTTHKMFKGAARSAQRLINQLEPGAITDEHQYAVTEKKVNLLVRELSALWSNPADKVEADHLKGRLIACWTMATENPK